MLNPYFICVFDVTYKTFFSYHKTFSLISQLTLFDMILLLFCFCIYFSFFRVRCPCFVSFCVVFGNFPCIFCGVLARSCFCGDCLRGESRATEVSTKTIGGATARPD